jgi:hypothetical protein
MDMSHPTRTTALALLISALCAGAHAQSARTREEVRIELNEAIRNGDMSSGESGLTLRQRFPGRYPQAAAPMPGLTRAQVQQELSEATRNGELLAGGEVGWRRNDGVPGGFPKQLQVGTKTRDEVRAELADAIHTGDVIAGGELGLPRNQLVPGLKTREAATMTARAATHKRAMQ